MWISPDPRGHIQATGVDTRGRTQYRYHDRWREQRDAQKFAHMLRFALALPGLREATLHDLDQRHLGRDRVAAAAVRLIDLGLFRIGGERYAELDHHYGVTTLEKRHVTVGREGVRFDYIAKEGSGGRSPSPTRPSGPPSAPCPGPGTTWTSCSPGSRTGPGGRCTPTTSATTSPTGPGPTSPPRSSGPGTPPC